jgi:hypothetical protein
MTVAVATAAGGVGAAGLFKGVGQERSRGEFPGSVPGGVRQGPAACRSRSANATEGPAGLRADLQDGAGDGGVPIITCFGGIDRRTQVKLANLLRTDTPRSIRLLSLRASG